MLRIAQKAGGKQNPTIVPFRGEYLELRADRRHLVRGNIYPVTCFEMELLFTHLVA